MIERIFRLLIRIPRLFPLVRIQQLGRGLGLIGYWLVKNRRKIALDNLDLAYGDSLTEKEKIAIAKSSFQNLVTMGLEVCYSPALPRQTEGYIKTINCEGYLQLYELGKGLLVLVPHMGSWEVVARVTLENGVLAHAVVRTQKQPWVTRIMKEIREANGLQVIYKEHALKPVISVLKGGGVVYMLIDQHARREAVVTQFFNRPAMTVASAALIAGRTKCSVMVGCPFRCPDGGMGLEFTEEIKITESGNTELDLQQNTQRFVDVMERYVRKYPGSWMWMHRRWRNQPESHKVGASDD